MFEVGYRVPIFPGVYFISHEIRSLSVSMVDYFELDPFFASWVGVDAKEDSMASQPTAALTPWFLLTRPDNDLINFIGPDAQCMV